MHSVLLRLAQVDEDADSTNPGQVEETRLAVAAGRFPYLPLRQPSFHRASLSLPALSIHLHAGDARYASTVRQQQPRKCVCAGPFDVCAWCQIHAILLPVSCVCVRLCAILLQVPEGYC